MLIILFVYFFIWIKVINADGKVAIATEIGPKRSFNRNKKIKKVINDIIENIIWTLKWPNEFNKTE